MSAKTLIDYDPWLEPHRQTINSRQAYSDNLAKQILAGRSVTDFALGYRYFGLQRTEKGWTLREWAPNAEKIVLVGDFSDWQELDQYELTRGQHGQWSISLPAHSLRHGQRYKLRVYWPGGDGWRIPSYATRVVQDAETLDFSAEVWQPAQPHEWQHDCPPAPDIPIIYEAHVGMSSEAEQVASYDYFRRDVLPRIKRAGYNTIQLMAIPEHPYYGSFGYHVTNFFAVSSRCGTPDDFKKLVDAAHGLGLRVILDLVHSHAAKNEAEGLSRFDGSLTQYFHAGERGNHPAWDSRVFDYGKPEVMHFLLSNCRWWLEEYRVDGFRFDGVTSMLYSHHGLEKSFTSYDDYFDDSIDGDALTYLRLANQVVHLFRPSATTIAEEMSGLPGVGAPTEHGGLGFDYRLQMGAPDLWIKTLKERSDEDWDLGKLLYTLHSHRPEERTIVYAESHDQALVGDKTLIFRLIDQDMYWHMQKSDDHMSVERGIALHKMIRLLTASAHSGGYLNFMGNEFGHPEWIDFPRQGNSWSYQYARRQWSLLDDPQLRYRDLAEFDRQLMQLLPKLTDPGLHYVTIHPDNNVLSFVRGNYLFVFNFSPSESYTDYQLPAPAGSYQLVLDSDDADYGGYGRIAPDTDYHSQPDQDGHQLRLYLPARTGFVLHREDLVDPAD